jgi:hypothetical protein
MQWEKDLELKRQTEAMQLKIEAAEERARHSLAANQEDLRGKVVELESQLKNAEQRYQVP